MKVFQSFSVHTKFPWYCSFRLQKPQKKWLVHFCIFLWFLVLHHLYANYRMKVNFRHLSGIYFRFPTTQKSLANFLGPQKSSTIKRKILPYCLYCMYSYCIKRLGQYKIHTNSIDYFCCIGKTPVYFLVKISAELVRGGLGPISARSRSIFSKRPNFWPLTKDLRCISLPRESYCKSWQEVLESKLLSKVA